jgi:hypothetical protein
MDIKEIVYTELKNRGCELTEKAGIVYVNTPDGEVWDFTTPLKYVPRNLEKED